MTAIWANEYVPRQWCQAVIVPIHNIDQKKKLENYRPISLITQRTRIVTEIVTAEKVKENQTQFKKGIVTNSSKRSESYKPGDILESIILDKQGNYINDTKKR